MDIQEMKKSFDEAEAERLVLTASQAAGLFSKTERTWRMWNEMGYIPQPVRIGRSLYWRYNELCAWVEEGCPERRSWQYNSPKKSAAKKK